MSLSQLISVLIARKWIFIWVFLVTVSVTTVVSFLLPKSYKATTSLVINAKGVDPITGLAVPASLMPGYMGTQVDIIQSHNVALKVVDKFGVATNPMAIKQFEEATKGEGDIRDFYADTFLAGVTVEPARQSSVVSIHYQSPDPKLAATMANAFAEAYITTNLQLKVEPAKQAAQWFDLQIKGLRQNVEKAQARVSSYQKEHGIAFAGERMDTEASRLAELSSQLVAAQAQTYDSTSRQSQLRQGDKSESPEILSNSLIQSLKPQLSQAQTRLSELSLRLGVNHPQYIAALEDVQNIRNLMQAEIAKSSSAVGQTARVSQQREGEIESALALQKDRVIKLKTQQDEMAVLMREVESAQRVYDSALQRFEQTNMEGQSSQTDISILNAALPPLTHARPKIMINILISIFMGALLGVGFALALEMFDRRVRSAEDLTRLLDVPLLGSLASNKQKKPNKLLAKISQLFKRATPNRSALAAAQLFTK